VEFIGKATADRLYCRHSNRRTTSDFRSVLPEGLDVNFDNFNLTGRTSWLASVRVHVKPTGVAENGLTKRFFAGFGGSAVN